MKIQPIDFNAAEEEAQPKCEAATKPVLKSRFKRLFERPFSGVLKTSVTDKPGGAAEPLYSCNKDGEEFFEPTSVCLSKMVQNYMEEGGEKQQQRCGRNRCNCFNRNCTESSDEELDSCNSCFSHACDVLKSLAPCVCVSERNLLADTAKIIEKHKINKRKDGVCRKNCGRWAHSSWLQRFNLQIEMGKIALFLAGEYEYVDAIIEGERLIIDIYFRSEFDIARPTKAYKLVLQTLPSIFVGKADRLEKIIGIASEAAKQSLKKKGMPFPPWRKADYVKSKWLSPFTRIGPNATSSSSTINNNQATELRVEKEESLTGKKKNSSIGEFELILGEKSSPVEINEHCEYVFVFSNNSSPCEDDDGVKSFTPPMKKWEPPEIRPKNINDGVKIVTGLASLIDNNKP